MPLFASSPLTSTPTDTVRTALTAALHDRHRPELGDLLAAADLLFDGTHLWVGISGAIDSAWFADQLLGAALEANMPLERIEVFPREREQRA